MAWRLQAQKQELAEKILGGVMTSIGSSKVSFSVSMEQACRPKLASNLDGLYGKPGYQRL